ncbi:hypothetical protein COLO4_35850 [Corchorus olitorius]|uniref:Uncharacterized protein n=1 Tax=Corchorus olitorius TaxID=93759 RepID=A0A1R3GCP3_9ROSI|nr:hypothetical protein COLO4_35850 [Corchorus olitorius]
MPLKMPSLNRKCGGSDLAQQAPNGASFKVERNDMGRKARKRKTRETKESMT